MHPVLGCVLDYIKQKDSIKNHYIHRVYHVINSYVSGKV